MSEARTPWHQADLVAVDLEGSGAQDRDDEAILEIAAVPLVAGHPVTAGAYTTLVNPGRAIPNRPWISPGLTNQALAAAPTLDRVEPELAARLNGRILVGHNIGVDWRLLHRRCPTITPAGLIDTLRLTRTLHLGSGHSLTALIDHLNLTGQVHHAAPDSRPHRAMWDTIAAAVLLGHLIKRRWATTPSIADLLSVAGASGTSPAPQQTLF